MRRILPLLLALALAPAASARVPSPCALLTNAEVAKVLGAQVASRISGKLGLEPTCTWDSAPLSSFTSARAEVNVNLAPISKARFEKEAKQTHGVPVHGVGEAALWLDGPAQVLWFWHHGYALNLQVIDVSSPQASATNLAKAMVNRF